MSDQDVARQVAQALKTAGLRVWIDEWELAAGDSIAQRVEEGVASSDILLVLLSPRSVASRWVEAELSTALSRELRDRAITVIPALIEDCVIPPLLADRTYIDLRRDRPAAISRLVEQISSAVYIDFSALDSRSFESLASDLLATLGFSIERTSSSHDSGFDFVASYRSRDPFGAEHLETWLVEVKLYQDQRVSVSVLSRVLNILTTSDGSHRGLIITNSRLTSIARNFLADSIRTSGRELRVIDGTELANLLIQHPEIVRAYFPLSGSHE